MHRRDVGLTSINILIHIYLHTVLKHNKMDLENKKASKIFNLKKKYEYLIFTCRMKLGSKLVVSRAYLIPSA